MNKLSPERIEQLHHLHSPYVDALLEHISEQEKELAEWRDIKEQMRCLTIYSKRDLQVKVAMQVRLREAAEKELARFRIALEAAAGMPIRVCNGYLRCTDRFVSAHVTEIARAALSPSQESSEETTPGEAKP